MQPTVIIGMIGMIVMIGMIGIIVMIVMFGMFGMFVHHFKLASSPTSFRLCGHKSTSNW